MKNKIKITVVTPAYNSASFIKRALDSVPERPDIEHIVVDDGSTDETSQVVQDYQNKHPNKQVSLFGWETNKGVSYGLNKGIEQAKGEYLVWLGSDDTFIKGELERAIPELDGTDLVFFDLIDNNQHIRHLDNNTKYRYVGSVKFMRREFITQNSLRVPENRRRAEDTKFTKDMLALHHTEKYLNRVVKFYNFPREGSISWNYRHGITDRFGHLIKGKE